MARLERRRRRAQGRHRRRAGPGFEWAPASLVPYLGNKDWKRAFGGFEQIEIGLHGDTHRVALLRLQPGKGLPVHRHVANEYTVVLQGGYTDNTGNYAVGDFAVGPGAAGARADRRSRRALHRADRGREADRADRRLGALAQPFIALGLDVTRW